MKKRYFLLEERVIAEYDTREEAEGDKKNNELWYPDREYRIIEVKE